MCVPSVKFWGRVCRRTPAQAPSGGRDRHRGGTCRARIRAHARGHRGHGHEPARRDRVDRPGQRPSLGTRRRRHPRGHLQRDEDDATGVQVVVVEASGRPGEHRAGCRARCAHGPGGQPPAVGWSNPPRRRARPARLPRLPDHLHRLHQLHSGLHARGAHLLQAVADGPGDPAHGRAGGGDGGDVHDLRGRLRRDAGSQRLLRVPDPPGQRSDDPVHLGAPADREDRRGRAAARGGCVGSAPLGGRPDRGQRPERG